MEGQSAGKGKGPERQVSVSKMESDCITQQRRNAVQKSKAFLREDSNRGFCCIANRFTIHPSRVPSHQIPPQPKNSTFHIAHVSSSHHPCLSGVDCNVCGGLRQGVNVWGRCADKLSFGTNQRVVRWGRNLAEGRGVKMTGTNRVCVCVQICKQSIILANLEEAAECLCVCVDTTDLSWATCVILWVDRPQSEEGGKQNAGRTDTQSEQVCS